MQETTMDQWLDQLDSRLSLAAKAAAECVRQAAIGSGADRDEVASGGEQALSSLKSSADNLHKFKKALSASSRGEIVQHLESFNLYANSAGSSFSLFTRDAKDVSGEVKEAVVKCREYLAALAADAERLMALSEVQEARLSHRAAEAKKVAEQIDHQLSQREC